MERAFSPSDSLGSQSRGVAPGWYGAALWAWLSVSCLAGCHSPKSITEQSTPARTPGPPPVASVVIPIPGGKLANSQPETILVREWHTDYPDNKVLRDRNGDGIVDYEATGRDRATDGFGVYKEDDDFDGFFDREYEAGGFAYHVNYEKDIHERVPRIPPVFPPTKITTAPKTSEMNHQSSNSTEH
jgi:hypothetical protein